MLDALVPVNAMMREHKVAFTGCRLHGLAYRKMKATPHFSALEQRARAEVQRKRRDKLRAIDV